MKRKLTAAQRKAKYRQAMIHKQEPQDNRSPQEKWQLKRDYHLSQMSRPARMAWKIMLDAVDQGNMRLATSMMQVIKHVAATEPFKATGNADNMLLLHYVMNEFQRREAYGRYETALLEILADENKSTLDQRIVTTAGRLEVKEIKV